MPKRRELMYISKSPDETLNLGTLIGEFLRPGDIISLEGGLGSGKTQFTRGLAYGLGVSRDNYITSPSFTLINEYQGRFPLYHFDLYRLGQEEQMEELGYEDYFFGQGVCVIEWGEKFPGVFPLEHLTVEMRCRGENTRELRITGTGDRFIKLLNKLEERKPGDGPGGTKVRRNFGS